MKISVFDNQLNIHAVSFGLGVQSTALVEKVLDGKLPRPDCIIFADPHWEDEGSYENLELIRPRIKAAGIPLHVVSAGNIRVDFKVSKRTELPFYVNASRYETIEGKLKLFLSDTKRAWYKRQKSTNQLSLVPEKSLEKTLHEAATAFGKRVQAGEIKSGWLNLNTSQIGRQCTKRYKIKPVMDYLRKHYGASSKNPAGQWLGISTDEWHRMKTSRIKATRLLYPLIELGMSREDCEDYLQEKGLPIPVKSACVGCPYHSDSTWKSLSDAQIDDAADFEEEMIQMIASTESLRYLPYFENGVRLHASMQPIDERPFETSMKDQSDDSPCTGEAGCFL